ncbi:MAG: hypothetical protein Hens3KO_23640 [Henriciella sp.]
MQEIERAERRRQNLRASWDALVRLDRERAEKQLQQDLADFEANKWTRIWTGMSAAMISHPAQAIRPTPQIDFYKSYSSSNISGRYVTSSGAVVSCAGSLGSGASC